MVENKAKRKGPGRPKTRHGGYTYLVTGKLPENRGYLRTFLEDTREGLIRDYGPTEADLSTAQLVMIDRIITALGVCRCIEEKAREDGVFHMVFDSKGTDSKGHILRGSLGDRYISFQNVIRLNLCKMNELARKEDPKTINVTDIIQGKVKK